MQMERQIGKDLLHRRGRDIEMEGETKSLAEISRKSVIDAEKNQNHRTG